MTTNIEHKTLSFDLKASADGGEFSGLGSVFHNVDAHGEIVAPGAFAAGLPKFLGDGFIGGLNHNWDEPIGKPVEAYETDRGLFVRCALAETAHGKDCRTLLKAGVVRKLSIGYRVTSDQTLDSKACREYWKAHDYTPSESDLKRCGDRPVRLLTGIELLEVSPVTVPANDRAAVGSVKRDATGEPDPVSPSPAPDGADAAPSFDCTSRQVDAAVREFAALARKMYDQRRKAGRVLSSANRGRIAAAVASMTECLTDLQALLDATEPEPPKSAGIAPTDELDRLILLASLDEALA